MRTRKQIKQNQSQHEPLSQCAKRMKQDTIEKYALQLLEIKENGKSRKETYGAFKKMMSSAREIMPWLTDQAVKSKANRIQAKDKKGAAEQANIEKSKKKIGRPIGATIQAKEEMEEKKVKAKVLMTIKLREAQFAAREQKEALPKGTFRKIHDDVLKDLELDKQSVSISYDTIKSRIYRNTSKLTHGPLSPAAQIENIIVTFSRYRQEAGQPMKPSEVIAFANSLVEGSEIEGTIKAFHNKTKRNPSNPLGKGWYRGFMRRHAKILSSGKGKRKHNARLNWTSYDNIETMYELLYEQMVEAKIAVHLPEEDHYWVDKKGNIVDSEDKAAGHKCTIKLIHPEWLLFGDEVGTDIAQDEDGHIGGQTYLSYNGRKIELTSSKASGRFTVMGLTAANGKPVMCIVIIAGKEIGVAEALGYDFQSETPYDTNKSLEENSGPGKALPGLPTCTFRGKNVPALLAVTPKGSMTSDILKSALEKLDELDIYKRTNDGPTPMVIFDGHDSRLQLPFLEYVNTERFGRALWKACIGLPNGTTKWQVGDSKQQNGCFKMSMTRNKDLLVLYKRRHHFESIDFKKSDIVPLICRAWKDSFGREKENLDAILERGWFHLDMRLLKDPEILQTKVTHVNSPATLQSYQVTTEEKTHDVCYATDDPIGPLGLNFHHGIAGDLTADLIRVWRKNYSVHKSLEQQKKAGQQANQRFKDFCKDQRMTAGTIFKFGKVVLDKNILEYRREKEAENEQKKIDALKTACQIYQKRMEKYENMIGSGYETSSKQTVSEIKLWLSVRKKKADGKMPQRREDLLKLQAKLQHRMVLTLREYLVDEGKAVSVVDRYLDCLDTHLNTGNAADIDEIPGGLNLLGEVAVEAEQLDEI